MNWIRIDRVLLAGLAAGVVVTLCEFVIGGFTGGDWQAIAEQLEIPQPGLAQGLGVLGISLLSGFVLVWCYAAMRPRFGPGPRTAVIAALTLWVIAWLFPHLSYLLLGLFPPKLMLIEIAGALVKYLAAALVGGWLYRESNAPD